MMMSPEMKRALYSTLEAEAAEIVVDMGDVPPERVGPWLADRVRAYIDTLHALNTDPMLIALHLGMCIGGLLVAEDGDG